MHNWTRYYAYRPMNDVSLVSSSADGGSDKSGCANSFSIFRRCGRNWINSAAPHCESQWEINCVKVRCLLFLYGTRSDGEVRVVICCAHTSRGPAAAINFILTLQQSIGGGGAFVKILPRVCEWMSAREAKIRPLAITRLASWQKRRRWSLGRPG